MTRASPTLRRAIAPALRSGLRALVLCVLLAMPAAANSRLKDIADFEGVRANLLVRLGVVVGLDGTGDSLRNAAFTKENVKAMLEHLEVGTHCLDLEPKNVAATMAPGTGELEVQSSYRGQIAALLTEIDQLRVRPDQPARIVIDERSGVIVMGSAARISQVAVVQGNLTVRVAETPQVSQPSPLAERDTVVVPRTGVEVEEDGARAVALEAGVSLRDLVAGLNALGVRPRDLIGILHAIEAAGALQAELVVM